MVTVTAWATVRVMGKLAWAMAMDSDSGSGWVWGWVMEAGGKVTMKEAWVRARGSGVAVRVMAVGVTGKVMGVSGKEREMETEMGMPHHLRSYTQH